MQNQIDPSVTGQALDLTDGITTGSLIAIALFAVVVIIGIVYGAKLKRARTAARAEVEARNDVVIADNAPLGDQAATDVPAAGALGEDSAGQTQTQVQSATEPTLAPPPLAPAPPPLDPAPTPAADPGDAPLTTLKGLGPKIADALAAEGITRIGQLATLDEAGAARLDAQLGAFTGRLYRDRWIEQARLLSAGDLPGYEARFGKL